MSVDLCDVLFNYCVPRRWARLSSEPCCACERCAPPGSDGGGGRELTHTWCLVRGSGERLRRRVRHLARRPGSFGRRGALPSSGSEREASHIGCVPLLPESR